MRKFIISESQKNKIISLIEQVPINKPSQPQTPQRTGTAVDGIIGKFTSQFKFPPAFIIDLNSGNVEKLGIQGNPTLQSIASQNKLTTGQMNQWNDFQIWLQGTGDVGKEELNYNNKGQKRLDEYLKINPNFWVKGPEDVKKVQAAMKIYRAYVLKDFLACREDIQKRVVSSYIKIDGIEQDCRNPDHVKNVKDNFMSWAKPETFKV